MKWNVWAGIILILIALLPSIGIVLNPGLVFAGPLLVLIAVAGGFLLVSTSSVEHHGWRLWGGLILIAIALFPTIGFIISPALVFTGPLLVLVAVAGGYLVARPMHHR